MRWLVTGGCGFIGHHLVRAVAEAGHRVVVLDKLTYAADPARVAGLAELVVGDVAEPADVARAFATAGEVDVLVHLAAESHVDRSIAAPAEFVRTNVLGTQVVVDAARTRGVGRLLHVSTDEVYGDLPAEAAPATEAAPFRPGSPYAASKVGAEALVTAAHRTYGLPTVVVRPANTFGTGQFPEKLLPVLLHAALTGRDLPLYGDGLQVRDWLAVGDLVAVLVALAAAPAGSVWNVAGAGPLPNREVAALVLTATGSASRIASVPDRPGHDRRYAMDGSALAARGLGARRTLAEGMAELVAEARGRLGRG
jgi:dTDP-glucose 4,6-dehydratase